MIERLKTALLSIVLLLSFSAAMVPASVGAAPKDDLCSGANLSLTGGSKNCDRDNPEDKLDKTVRIVVNIISTIIGIVAVIMIIFGGFKYITSAGEASNLASARNTII